MTVDHPLRACARIR